MSRTRHSPHWDKTNGHKWWKKYQNKKLRRQPKVDKLVIKKTGPG